MAQVAECLSGSSRPQDLQEEKGQGEVQMKVRQKLEWHRHEMRLGAA
jgi:hypothetical protein